MRLRKTVKVAYDGTSGILTVDSPSVQLEQEDWVEWEFSNVPANCVPWIRFEDSRGLGPFQCLQLVPNTTTVQGKGNVGGHAVASYAYTAWLLTYDGVQARSAPFPHPTVVNSPQAPNTSPEVVVVYSQGSYGEVKLEVHPERLELAPGDMATWNVLHLPADHFVTFHFDSLTPLFDSYLNCRLESGEETGVVRICGIHFNDPNQQLHYDYHIAVRDRSGRVVASHDPTIDNLGEPPLGSG